MIPKMKKILSQFPGVDTEVEVGVSHVNIGCCAEAGATVIVAGRAVTGPKNKQKTVIDLREEWNKAILLESQPKIIFCRFLSISK